MSALRTPCAADPAAWDLDQRSPGDWLRSMALCAACPRLEVCRAEVAALPERPRCLIWAGIAYGDDGQELRFAQLIRHRHGRATNPETVTAEARSTGSRGAA